MLSEPDYIDHQVREQKDRRKHGLKSFIYSLFMRRRRGMRRTEDHTISHYVDIYDHVTVWTAIAIIILSSADSLLTLMLIQEGRAYEANPVMEHLIQSDTGLFVAGKAALTILSLLFLIVHKNFWIFNNRLRTRSILFATFFAYTVLINYELVLLHV